MKGSDPAFRRLVTGIALDLRSAFRGLRRSPVITALVVLTLAVGLGGTTAIFGVVETVFWSALPFGEGDRLVRLRSYAVTAGGDVRGYNMTPRDFSAIREANAVFEDVVAQQGFSVSLLGGDTAERINVIRTSPRWAETLRIEPATGRAFTADEERRGPDAGVALVSHGLWKGTLGGDPEVLGRVLTTTAGSYAVVGVMPPGFVYPYDADVWIPWRWDRSEWQAHDLNVVGRMRDGVTLEAVESDMERVYAGLEEQFPGATPDTGVEVTLARDNFIVDQAQVLRSLFVAVGFLLLLACFNVGNLLVVQFSRRGREIGLRAALGADRLRLVRQLVTETVLVFLLGAVGAMALTVWLGDLLGVLVPDVLRTQLALGEIRVGPTVLAFGVGVAVLCGLAFGVVAALQGSSVDLRSLLVEGSKSTSGRSSRRLQKALVVLQVALSVILLVGAGVLGSHLRKLQERDLGFELDGLFTFQLEIAQEPYDQEAPRMELLRGLQERLRAVPEIEEVGVTTVNPLCCGDWGASIAIEGREPPEEGAPILIHHRYVMPEYFEAMEIPILRGRNFSVVDTLDSVPTVIVDENLADRFWPGEDPIGKRLRSARPGQPWRTVVGVVPTVYREGDYTEGWYLPYSQEPLGRPTDRLHVMVRSRSPEVMSTVREVVAGLDRTLAVDEVAAMSDLRGELVSQERLGAIVATLFAGFGLLLALFGLFGLLSHEIQLRALEIGTRMALGATRAQIVALVVRQGAVLVTAGVLLGLVGSLATNQVLRSMVDGLGWIDPRLAALLVAGVFAFSLLAFAVPAIRAVRIEPARTLRQE